MAKQIDTIVTWTCAVDPLLRERREHPPIIAATDRGSRLVEVVSQSPLSPEEMNICSGVVTLCYRNTYRVAFSSAEGEYLRLRNSCMR